MSNTATASRRAAVDAAIIREPGAVLTLPAAVRFRVPGYGVYVFAVPTERGTAIQRHDHLTGRRRGRALATTSMAEAEQAARNDLIDYLIKLGA